LPSVTAAPSEDVVISQVFGGGGTSNAPYQNDFVELFNRGSAGVSLLGWSVQYASATGQSNFNGTSVVLLPNVTLQPGQYFLIHLSGGDTGVHLPTADATGTIVMAGSGGKVILATTTSGLPCNGSSTPCSLSQLARIKDLVGYGNANYFEGPAAVPAMTDNTAAIRANAGCTDTDSNSTDFTSASPTPRNTAAPLHPCGSSSEADADSDGVPDAVDNCVNVPNPDQADADGDGIGNACDPTPNGPDTDSDGIPDATDNCVNASNSDQADADSDGIGNVCDLTPNGPDTDGDGVADSTDNCMSASNADQADTDADGIGDLCDPDDDGDGFTDAQEAACNGDPADPSSTCVPGKAARCQNSGWTQVVDSDGNQFKNQGDCVSFVATRAKNRAAGF
jgi:hypothetical protein